MEGYCKNIAYGMAGKWFYCLSEQKEQEECYYCLYKVDECPPSMRPEDIGTFMDENADEGDSYTGDWESVMGILEELLSCQLCNNRGRTLGRKLEAEELVEHNFQCLREFLNTDLAVFVHSDGEYTLEPFDYEIKIMARS